jgi:6-phosphogluconolactonase (cycloisomerase 2 family)
MSYHAQHRATSSWSAILAALAGCAFAACTDQTSPAPTETSTEATADLAASGKRHAGAVYTTTNGAGSNAIIAFGRAADGSLTRIGRFPTGGRGIGGTIDPLVSQYAVILSANHSLLFTVNAGSNNVSSFRVRNDGTLKLVDVQSAGGVRPVSLAARGRLLYVLNAGDNTVTGIRVSPGGELHGIRNGTRQLAPGAAGASTIHFTANGARVIVTEIGANRLETLVVRDNGRLGPPVVTPSTAAGPFGFDVTKAGVAVISEAGGTPASAPNGTVSSYRRGAGGALNVVTDALDAGGQAACWVVVTENGRFAFVANSGSNAIASVRIRDDGSLRLLDATAGTSPAGAIPLDIDLSLGDDYLYALEGGSGKIAIFAVGAGGSLSARTAVPTGRGGSSGLQGIAAF